MISYRFKRFYTFISVLYERSINGYYRIKAKDK
jgi:hypothetical protein